MCGWSWNECSKWHSGIRFHLPNLNSRSCQNKLDWRYGLAWQDHVKTSGVGAMDEVGEGGAVMALDGHCRDSLGLARMK